VPVVFPGTWLHCQEAEEAELAAENDMGGMEDGSISTLSKEEGSDDDLDWMKHAARCVQGRRAPKDRDSVSCVDLIGRTALQLRTRIEPLPLHSPTPLQPSAAFSPVTVRENQH